MAHFAEIDQNNQVVRVIVVNNKELLDENGIEKEEKGIDFCKSLFGGNWKQTSYNAKFRKNYAGVGFVYNEELDAFIPPKPYESWLLNMETGDWKAPVDLPADSNEQYYEWDEENLNWVLVPRNSERFRPFPSWSFNEDIQKWEAPLPFPTTDPEEGKMYVWNENSLDWIQVDKRPNIPYNNITNTNL